MPGLAETVVEVSEIYLNRHEIRCAHQLRDAGHNVSQIAKIMGKTWPCVNRLLNPNYQYYQSANNRSELDRRLKRYERLAVEGLKLKAKGLSIQEICGELRTKRPTLLRAFEMAPAQGWDVMAGERGGQDG